MAMLELMAVVAPPTVPVEAGPVTRKDEIEKALGIVLPDEIWEFGLRYGSGRFGGEIEVFNPFARKYLAKVNDVCDCYRGLKEDEGDDFIPYAIFPKTPGLLPWGGTMNGHVMFWLTEGPPDDWPIVLLRGREADQSEELRMEITTFLAKVFKGPMPCVLWEVEWQTSYLVGKPFRPAEPYEL